MKYFLKNQITIGFPILIVGYEARGHLYINIKSASVRKMQVLKPYLCAVKMLN